MKNRCTNPKDKQYKNYGGRGITVCERWMTFENFFDDMGPRPDGLSLERTDFNKGYAPGNCIWADIITQAWNRRTTVFIEYEGEKIPRSVLAKRLGINECTLRKRLRGGASLDQATFRGLYLAGQRTRFSKKIA